MAFYLRQLELIVEFKHPLMCCRNVNRSRSAIMVRVSTIGENAIWCQTRGGKKKVWAGWIQAPAEQKELSAGRVSLKCRHPRGTRRAFLSLKLL